MVGSEGREEEDEAAERERGGRIILRLRTTQVRLIHDEDQLLQLFIAGILMCMHCYVVDALRGKQTSRITLCSDLPSSISSLLSSFTDGDGQADRGSSSAFCSSGFDEQFVRQLTAPGDTVGGDATVPQAVLASSFLEGIYVRAQALEER